MSSSPPAAPRLYRGRIVEASVLDLQGGNRKKRPCVIVTPTDQIQPGQPFQVVGVTTQGERYLSLYNVPIPGGKPLIRISWDSDAVCNWVVSIKEADIVGLLGRLPPNLLDRVLTMYDRFKATQTRGG